MTDDHDIPETDSWDDDVPWADPSIREDYEITLGKIILAYNYVDYLLTKVLSLVLSKLGHVVSNQFLEGKLLARLQTFELLHLARPDLGLHQLDCKSLRKLNADRNALAHGHFDQNPFDGSYDVLGKKGYTAKDKINKYPLPLLKTILTDLDARADELRSIEASFIFEPIRD